MFEPVFQDLFATKGAEYLLVIAFLACLIVFWRALTAPPVRALPSREHATSAGWFLLAEDRLYHPGHGWARPEQDGTVRVGLDEFAAKLVGHVARISLPDVGATVGQGEVAWRMVAADGRGVDMLSPVDGTVVDVNGAVASTPNVAEQDPYERGWLFKVQPSRLRANRLHLLSGRRARQWIEEVLARWRSQFAPDLGLLLEDGGVPVAGMARAVDPEHWDTLARTLLLTSWDEPEPPDPRVCQVRPAPPA